jgi:hypothetical protein
MGENPDGALIAATRAAKQLCIEESGLLLQRRQVRVETIPKVGDIDGAMEGCVPGKLEEREPNSHHASALVQRDANESQRATQTEARDGSSGLAQAAEEPLHEACSVRAAGAIPAPALCVLTGDLVRAAAHSIPH